MTTIDEIKATLGALPADDETFTLVVHPKILAAHRAAFDEWLKVEPRLVIVESKPIPLS